MVTADAKTDNFYWLLFVYYDIINSNLFMIGESVMGVIYDLVESCYRDFAGLPNNRPIVRNNTPEDAFTLAILNVMYSRQLDLEVKPDNIVRISNIIVAPPDSGIDLFVEIEDGDEYYYDIIQSKYANLSPEALRSCFLTMKDTVKRYLKNRDSVSDNLRHVIEETNFTESYKNNCTYYVYHTGVNTYSDNFKNNEKVITIDEMEVIWKSLGRKDYSLKVPYYEFTSDMFNNYILYEDAMLCNIRGYDLAELCNRYISSSMGRNILFGQNLRDSLNENKSKTYEYMIRTIDTEPEKFWNYNNGITIICEDLDAIRPKKDAPIDMIQISDFSIINGAQTTSTLGAYLRKACLLPDEEKKNVAIEKLKSVYVLVRIMKVTNENFRNSISIYNNLQNPISSRDQVANNAEQVRLYNWLLDGTLPNMYVEIRRGHDIPPTPRFEKHQKTTNEDLAQLAFSAFLLQPFKAKDKKKHCLIKIHQIQVIL